MTKEQLKTELTSDVFTNAMITLSAVMPVGGGTVDKMLDFFINPIEVEEGGVYGGSAFEQVKANVTEYIKDNL